jgi:hypothetical protein
MSGTGPRRSVVLGEMTTVTARAAAVTATEAKYQVRRRGPESSAGDQRSLITWGSCAACDTVAMSVIGTPRDRRTNGTAMLANPTVTPERQREQRPEGQRDRPAVTELTGLTGAQGASRGSGRISERTTLARRR